MNEKKVGRRSPGFVAMIVGVWVLCLSATSGFPGGDESLGSSLGGHPCLLAGVTPDYSGLDTADAQIVERKDPAWSVGAGVGVVPEYEGSEDYEGVPLLFVRAGWTSGRYVQFLASTLKANVLASHNWSFGPMARYRAERDDDVDNNKVKRMREIDEAIELGAFVGYTTGNWHVSLQTASDVNDAHDGLVMTLEGGYTLPLDQGVRLGMSLLASYADDDYMDTYFGVDADNAGRSGLPQYEADS